MLASLSIGDVPDGELRLQYAELGKACTGVVAATAPKTAANSASSNSASADNASLNNATPRTATTAGAVGQKGRYSVQLAAYNTRVEAEASVQRLLARGMDVRVDGDVKPFRVRTGYFATRAEAAAVLARLKQQGMDGFVADLRP